MAEFKYLYERVPIYTSEGEKILNAREDNFDQWYDKNRWKIKRDYDLLAYECYPMMPGQHLWLSNDVEIIIPESADTVVYKGLAVRLEMFAILDLIDSKNVGLRDQSYFVLIDGSGAFTYDNVKLVLDKLITQKYPIVLGRRPAYDPTWCMGHEDRKKVEFFEKFLLEQKYKEQIEKQFRGELPDAQAGCWGINMGVLKYLSLTAQEYGLEFDVTSSALEAGLTIGYTDDLECDKDRRIGLSGFSGFDKSIKKMEFILHKLSYSKGELNELLNNYKQLPNYRDKELPQDYESSLMEFINI